MNGQQQKHQWVYIIPVSSSPISYDLQDRLIDLAVSISRLCESLPPSHPGQRVAGQLLRSGTAPAPLHAEARGAESRRDFIHKLRLCLKELRETMSWLQFLHRRGIGERTAVERVMAETDQLIAIIYTSIRTAERNRNTTHRLSD